MDEHRYVELDEGWLEEWIAFGLRELDAYLVRHAAFTEWLEARGDDR
jgi:hypothetical protein